MGKEINLLLNYPKSKRNIQERENQKSDEDRTIARKFGKEFFDGDRRIGYGGYRYDKKYWGSVVPDFYKHYSLDPDSKVLDVGCAKGFMLWDFLIFDPTLLVKGIDISEYAVSNGHPSVKDHLLVGDAREIPFPDNEFDLVISLGTIHNLKVFDVKKAVKEIERVGRSSYVMLESYRNLKELFNLQCWALTCESFFHKKEWLWLYQNFGYTGDYEFIYFE